MEVSVNGERRVIEAESTVTDLLAVLGVDAESPGIAVAVNYVVVRRTDWRSARLDAGDEVEIVTATQGG